VFILAFIYCRVLCIASFIFEWWTLTTTPSVVRFYVTGKINICDGSGANCAPGSLAQVSGSNNSSTGMTATRILALVMTSINLLNGIFVSGGHWRDGGIIMASSTSVSSSPPCSAAARLPSSS